MGHPQDPLVRVIDAVSLAAEAHRHQRRKDAAATPYINHPISLLHILGIEAGVTDSDVLCAAALHDYLEDCCGQKDLPSIEEGRATLSIRFGTDVLTYVDAVTDDKSLPKEERKQLQIEHAAQAPLGARLIKLADKIANLRDITASPPAGWSLTRRQEYFDWAKHVVDRIRGTHAHLESLFDAEYAYRPVERL
jgi:guanosine-3',5'-bis(diphosphate) 3'-pyrophosphohydrolase